MSSSLLSLRSPDAYLIIAEREKQRATEREGGKQRDVTRATADPHALTGCFFLLLLLLLLLPLNPPPPHSRTRRPVARSRVHCSLGSNSTDGKAFALETEDSGFAFDNLLLVPVCASYPDRTFHTRRALSQF